MVQITTTVGLDFIQPNVMRISIYEIAMKKFMGVGVAKCHSEDAYFEKSEIEMVVVW